MVFFVYFIYLLIIQDVLGVTWPCQNSEDCSFIENATCYLLTNTCRCPAGYVFSLNSPKCVKISLHGDKCDESVQCSHMLSGAKCMNGNCNCDDGFTYIRGRCRQLNNLNKNCNEDIDCFFGYDRESVVCANQRCECARGYYERYGNICRRKSMELGDPCIVDQDCQIETEPNAKCQGFLCTVPEKRRVSREIGVQTSIDYSYKPKSYSVGRSNDSTEEYIELKTVSSASDSKGKKFGNECTKNGGPCDDLEHSICIENVCYCAPGYYENGGNCFAEIGEKAVEKKFCSKVYNEETKRCMCTKNFFAAPSMRDCRKPVNSIGSSCLDQNQCSPFGEAYCPSESPKTCKCHNYAVYDEKRQLCVGKEGIGAYCSTDGDCTVPHTKCSDAKLCVCREHYFEHNEKCAKGLGADCDDSQECQKENSTCLKANSTEKGVCHCQKGYVQYMNGCVKAAAEVGDECLDNEQCKPLLGKLGKCIKEKCTCEEVHQLSNGECNEKKLLGDNCSKSSECFATENVKSIECRNAVCQCTFGYNRNLEQQICVKSNKNNSSGRPSPLKVITLLLFTSAFLVTSAAIKNAYFDS